MLINSGRNYYALKLFKSLINLNKKENFPAINNKLSLS